MLIHYPLNYYHVLVFHISIICYFINHKLTNVTSWSQWNKSTCPKHSPEGQGITHKGYSFVTLQRTQSTYVSVCSCGMRKACVMCVPNTLAYVAERCFIRRGKLVFGHVPKHTEDIRYARVTLKVRYLYVTSTL